MDDEKTMYESVNWHDGRSKKLKQKWLLAIDSVVTPVINEFIQFTTINPEILVKALINYFEEFKTEFGSNGYN